MIVLVKHSKGLVISINHHTKTLNSKCGIWISYHLRFDYEHPYQ